jgi:hypothetical protein
MARRSRNSNKKLSKNTVAFDSAPRIVVIDATGHNPQK